MILNNKISYSIVGVDGATNELVAKETYPGMGTLSFTGTDSLKRIVKDLPESEE